MQEDKIPVIILAGFLGAGKTTVLNHILRNSNGQRIGVIVNDFGEVNIDTLLVSKQTENTMELSGGCICCQMSDGGLDETLATLAHPGSTIDAIIIEASGIAEPADLRKLILYSSNKMLAMQGVTYVIDAGNILNQLQEHSALAGHIAAADLLVLNKVDLVDTATLKSIEQVIREHNPDVMLVHATDGAIPPELLFDQEPATNEQLSLSVADTAEHTHHHNHHHLHEQFNSVSFETSRPLSPKRVDTMLASLPKNVYRLKGVIYYGMKGFEQKIIIHKVGRHIRQSAEDWHAHETPKSQLVAIGVSIDSAAIKELLQSCIDPNPDDMAADDMIDIMRLKGF